MITWISPLPFSFKIDAHDTVWKPHLDWLQKPFLKESSSPILGLPTDQHPGSFGYVRTHHQHEGVDLYAPEGTPVFAVEAGKIVSILDFTGEKVGSPWWNDTQSVMIEGASGVVNLGELIALSSLKVGQYVQAGDLIGYLTPVLKKFKGRPQTMLHLELYQHGQREAMEWTQKEKPKTLLNPTSFLLSFTKS